MQVKWLRKAALNLEDAHDHLAKENSRVAQEFVLEVYRLVHLLVDQPAMGRPGRVPGTRELVLQPYPFLIPYRVKGEEIQMPRDRSGALEHKRRYAHRVLDPSRAMSAVDIDPSSAGLRPPRRFLDGSCVIMRTSATQTEQNSSGGACAAHVDRVCSMA